MSSRSRMRNIETYVSYMHLRNVSWFLVSCPCSSSLLKHLNTKAFAFECPWPRFLKKSVLPIKLYIYISTTFYSEDSKINKKKWRTFISILQLTDINYLWLIYYFSIIFHDKGRIYIRCIFILVLISRFSV
jgi:hypothetical protein